MKDSRNLKVLIADDHADTLKVVSTFLDEHFCVLAAVLDGHDLIRATVDLLPDVVVSDLEMPGLSGLDVISELRSLGLDVPVVLMGAETKGVVHLLCQGAAAYVHKYDICVDLIDAILLAKSGHKFLSRSVLDDKRLLKRPENP